MTKVQPRACAKTAPEVLPAVLFFLESEDSVDQNLYGLLSLVLSITKCLILALHEYLDVRPIMIRVKLR